MEGWARMDTVYLNQKRLWRIWSFSSLLIAIFWDYDERLIVLGTPSYFQIRYYVNEYVTVYS